MEGFTVCVSVGREGAKQDELFGFQRLHATAEKPGDDIDCRPTNRFLPILAPSTGIDYVVVAGFIHTSIHGMVRSCADR